MLRFWLHVRCESCLFDDQIWIQVREYVPGPSRCANQKLSSLGNVLILFWKWTIRKDCPDCLRTIVNPSWKRVPAAGRWNNFVYRHPLSLQTCTSHQKLPVVFHVCNSSCMEQEKGHSKKRVVDRYASSIRSYQVIMFVVLCHIFLYPMPYLLLHVARGGCRGNLNLDGNGFCGIALAK